MQAETKNPNAMLGLIGLTGLAGLISAMVQLTHPYKWLARITKLGFWLPLLLIAVQYFRQIYSPNDGLSTLAKLVIVIFILCGGYALSCIATSPAKINQYIKGLFA
jgi:hypothetical protein